MALVDNFGRPLLNLRISITQRCNLKCTYCHREGEAQNINDSEEKMSVTEIIRIANIGIDLGITRIKLTGGEPLIRPDLFEVIKGIASIPRLRDLSISTNGTLLADKAKNLRLSGLKRLNISLPTLNSDKYNRITGGTLEQTLNGIRAAVETEFYPIKLNMVILNGINENDIFPMIDYAQKMGIILQIIELDPVNVSSSYYREHHKNLDGLEAILQKRAVNVRKRQFMHNRKIYNLEKVIVEVVHPIENCEFCMHCTRMRITSDGKLKPCLMKNYNLIDILTPMRRGANDDQIKKLFLQANQQREPYNK